MKKASKIILITVCLLCLLTGCYEQNTVISVGPMGGIKAEILFAGNDEGIGEITGGATYEDLQSSLIPQLEALVTDVSKEKVEEVVVEKDGEQYRGVKLTGYFSTLDEMYGSAATSALNSYNMIPAPVVTNDVAEGDAGISFKADKGILGTKYTAFGTIRMAQDEELDDEMRAAMNKCEINVKFKFPVASFTVSKGNKNFIKPTFVYEATTENDNIPVDFSVYVPNYLGIFTTLIIIGLIVAVVLMAKKIKELNMIISGKSADEETEAADAEGFISEDDENFFEGTDESVEFAENAEEIEEEIVVEEASEEDSEE